MKVGVKFCGGCNPTYNRGDALEKIVEHFKGEAEFSHAEPDKNYDVLLVISGCANRCATIDNYMYKQLVHVWSGDSITNAIEQIEQEI